ncbi:Prolyl carboxy peptidase like protein [Trichinella pseudospiralis]
MSSSWICIFLGRESRSEWGSPLKLAAHRAGVSPLPVVTGYCAQTNLISEAMLAISVPATTNCSLPAPTRTPCHSSSQPGPLS